MADQSECFKSRYWRIWEMARLWL